MTITDSVIGLFLKVQNRNRLPQTSGTLTIPGLHSTVEIYRDHLGIPHIFSDQLEDLIFAQGFVHAQDRLWQIEFQRRLVSGRLSEMIGSSSVKFDKWLRTLSMRWTAEQEIQQISGEEKTLVEAYCAGVNTIIDQHRWPLEFSFLSNKRPDPYEPADILAWGKMMAWTLSSNWENELLRAQLIEKLGSEKAADLEISAQESWPTILESTTRPANAYRKAKELSKITGAGPTEGVGSNNWAVSGQRSTTGKPLLANDMHLGLSIPAIWYENHLCGGGLNVTGVSLPGVPLVISGHNGKVAWGYTAAFADVQDLFEENLSFNEDGSVDYEFQGEWCPAEVREETINVNRGKKVSHTVITTRHGPIISELVEKEIPNTPYALQWTALTPSAMIQPLLEMNKAQDCLQFHEALRSWTSPVLNVVYADITGNIAYSMAGKVPIRAQGEGNAPVLGYEGDNEWIGFIPFESMPHIMNPSSGILATANNRTTNGDYPYFLGKDYIDGDRAERILELLSATELHDVDSFKRMQFDQVSVTARYIAQHLSQLKVDDPMLIPILDLLRGWDGHLAVDSPAAAIHEVFMRKILALLLENQLGDLTKRYMGKGPLPLVQTTSIFGSRSWEWFQKLLTEPDSPWWKTENSQNMVDLLCKALSETNQFLTDRLGSNPEKWQWGKIHRITFEHVLSIRPPADRAFNRGPYPIGGDGTTLWASLARTESLSGDTLSGPPFRFIADMHDIDHCLGLLAPGQSGQPGSKHYDDQINDWFHSGYHVMLYQRSEIEADVESKLILKPGGEDQPS